MINSSEVLKYKVKGFDGEKYLSLQKEKILERIEKAGNGRLYLEIGGKFLFDTHAARVLPGFIPDSKKRIFVSLKDRIEILFCVNANDIVSDRQLTNEDVKYADQVRSLIKRIEVEIGIKPHVVINNIDIQNKFDLVLEFEKDFQRKGYKVRERYKITGYPHATRSILSENGFGNDDHIPLQKNLILVTGAASNSGKMSTCLGQIFNDHQIGIDSTYAKYETFPVWDISIDHPINLAYEAATVDIGDFNQIDPYHQKAYGVEAVNYNRDVEAFEVITGITKHIVKKDNLLASYKSPTDMGISTAGLCITDDQVVSVASLEEIRRRKIWAQELVDRGDGNIDQLSAYDELEKKCLSYCQDKKYNIDLNLL